MWRCRGMGLRSSGGALRVYGRVGSREVLRSEALEARCRRAGVEVWISGALEARCRRVDVEMSTYGDLSSGGVLRVYGRVGGREVWSSGGALQACIRGD